MYHTDIVISATSEYYTNIIEDDVSQVKLKHMSTILLKSHAAEKKKGKKSIMIPIIGKTNIQQEWFMKWISSDNEDVCMYNIKT